MFGRLASFVQQAAEVLAPTASLQEDFIHHWKAVTHYLLDSKDDRQPIEATNVPDHLLNMVELLCEEESQSDGTTGPCMEYLLQHKILETLHTLGRADCPPGMKQQVLRFFTSVIGRAQQPLLPNIHVHKPVLRLIHCCADNRASPTEGDEVHFLCTVASNLKQHPHLASVFLEHRPTSTSAEPTKASTTRSPRRDQPPADPDHAKFHLLATLLELSKSEDRRVSLKACEGMLLCASLDNESAARSIANNSPFCQILADRIQSTFASIPLDLPAQRVLSCTAKWGMEGGTDDEEPYDGKTELRAWLSWVDYFDQLAISAHPVVADALLESLQERFFRSQLAPRLTQMSEHGLVVSTALVAKLVEVLAAPVLVHGLVVLLIGDDKLPADAPASEPVAELCRNLIARCDHVNEELSLMSLQLFSFLLQKNDPLVMGHLVLRYMDGKKYLKQDVAAKDNLQEVAKSSANGASPKPNTPSSTPTLEPSVDNSSAEPSSSAGATEPAELQADVRSSSVSSDSTIATSSTPEQPPAPVEGISLLPPSPSVDAAAAAGDTLTLSATSSPLVTPTLSYTLPSLPETPTTAAAPSRSTAVEASVNEGLGTFESSAPQDIEPLVQRLFAERARVENIVNTFLTMLPELAKTSLHMPSSGYDEYVRDAQSQVSRCFSACQKWEKSPSSPCTDRDSFSEGPFLSLLFNKLQRSLDQPYEINLTVTGLLSRVAYFPHRDLHSYLLDPFLALEEDVRSLNSVLQQICAEISLHAQRSPGFQSAVLAARHRLSGAKPTQDDDASSSPNDNLYEAVVVLEEFCKELAAVVFVKSAVYLQQCPLA